MTMTARRTARQDWTYRDARRRMVRAGRAQLPRHSAVARLDDRGNRIVDCGCGWTGNGLGWAGHLDSVVRAALEAEMAGWSAAPRRAGRGAERSGT
jgi:hypothetical protein